jgi:hypothetical protein
MVKRPEEYEYSGHRAYLGLDRPGLVDTEPVLRHFGATKRRAIEVYSRFVNAALGQSSQQMYYRASEGRMLGSEDFVEEIKHRIGDHQGKGKKRAGKAGLEAILKTAEKATGMRRRDFCTNNKTRELVMIKEAIIVIGYENGIRVREIADALGVDTSAVSKRREVARVRDEVPAPARKLLRKMRRMLE